MLNDNAVCLPADCEEAIEVPSYFGIEVQAQEEVIPTLGGTREMVTIQFQRVGPGIHTFVQRQLEIETIDDVLAVLKLAADDFGFSADYAYSVVNDVDTEVAYVDEGKAISLFYK